MVWYFVVVFILFNFESPFVIIIINNYVHSIWKKDSISTYLFKDLCKLRSKQVENQIACFMSGGNFTSPNYNSNTIKIVSHDLNICANIRFPDNWHEGNNVFLENVSHMWLGKTPKLLWRNITVHSADFQLIDDVCGHQCHRRAGMFWSVSVHIVLCDCVILPLNVFMFIVVILIDCSSKSQLYSTCVHNIQSCIVIVLADSK